MHIARDPGFQTEKERFSFVHCCEDCGHFDPDSARCRHEYPTEGHRRADAQAGDLVFCKEFELC